MNSTELFEAADRAIAVHEAAIRELREGKRIIARLIRKGATADDINRAFGVPAHDRVMEEQR